MNSKCISIRHKLMAFSSNQIPRQREELISTLKRAPGQLRHKKPHSDKTDETNSCAKCEKPTALKSTKHIGHSLGIIKLIQEI